MAPAYPSLPRAIAHRGGGAFAPENTLAGFRLAAARGFTAVEFDVRLARCGTLMLLHDATLDRTTDARGLLRERTRAELTGVDAAAGMAGGAFAGEPIPTLEDAWQCCTALGLAANVEIKADAGDEAAAGEAAGRMVARCWGPTSPPVVISSFSPLALAQSAREATGVPHGLLVESIPPDWEARLAAVDATGLHAGVDGLADASVAALVARGVPTIVYTVNDIATARRLLGLGVAAIVTDRIEEPFASL